MISTKIYRGRSSKTWFNIFFFVFPLTKLLESRVFRRYSWGWSGRSGPPLSRPRSPLSLVPDRNRHGGISVARTMALNDIGGIDRKRERWPPVVIYSSVMNRGTRGSRTGRRTSDQIFTRVDPCARCSTKNHNYTSVRSSRCNFIDGSRAGLMDFRRIRRPTRKSYRAHRRRRRQEARDDRTSLSRAARLRARRARNTFGGGVRRRTARNAF